MTTNERAEIKRLMEELNVTVTLPVRAKGKGKWPVSDEARTDREVLAALRVHKTDRDAKA